ncbi:DMT family transporter [Fertoebacter nigrum]|uniref:DMT family transporter n=1 Tax=Fertoeibacter niger TaxID=2656921 RepID=A0A8X8GTV5_9RHOB|nr:DMT family transporter [Fertoeibacter niger]NUB43002.1 DMT family transporter [Fertoeibacter niger]
MVAQKSLSPRAWAELLLLAFIWGGSFLANRLALDELGVFTTVAARVAGACLILWVWVALKGLTVPRSARVWAAFLGMGMLNNVIPFSLITWGQLVIPTGLAAILNASTAILGVLVAAILFRDERLTGRRLAGVGIGFAGVVVVIGPSALLVLDLTSLAQLALLGAALSYACAGAFARVALRGLTPQVAAAGMLTGSTLVAVPLALLLEGAPALHHGPAAWGAVAYLAAVSTAFAYLLYYRVLGMAGAGNLSLVTLLVAPVAIVLGALVLDEALPLRAYAGFALLGLGLLVIDGRVLRYRNSGAA